MRPSFIAFVCLALAACGGDSRAQTHPATTSIEEADLEPPALPSAAEPGSAPDESETAPIEAEPDPFATDLPTAACPDTVRVAVAHQNGPELPTWLENAVAFRSEDGRHLRIAIANHPLELDAAGRFAHPSAGQARFEMDATRTRRGALSPRVLGRPDARNGGLTHARIVSSGPLLTFGHRNIGRVEITAVDETHVCGRIELDDGFGRVRGAFDAAFAGPLPH